MDAQRGEPHLSVVVPFYDVEAYFDEALASVAAQTFTDLEVVMVDDGSSDGSVEIARAWCERDPRFRLVRQENHGLGHARNTGVRNATGRLLTFLDSDDVVPGYAYGVLVRTIEETGSDFVSGNVWRFDSTGTRQAGLHRVGFRGNARRTHLSRRRDLMTDRLVPNKVFRRSFWDGAGLAFPEGVLYEDIPLTIPAHFQADSVDVVSVPVYLWRTRESGPVSITQDRTHLRGLNDRFAAITSVREFLVAGDHGRAVAWFDDVVLRSDIRIFMDAVGSSGAEFGARFLELANAYLAQVDDAVLAGLPAVERVRYALVRRGALAELDTVTKFIASGLDSAVPVRVGDRYLGDYPFRGDPQVGIPDDTYDVTDQLTLRTRIESARWFLGWLRLRGWAYVDGIGAEHSGDQTVRAWVVAPAAEPGDEPLRVPLRVRQLRSDRADEEAGPAVPATGTGVRIDLPVRYLLLRTRREPADWSVDVEVTAGGVTRLGRLGRRVLTAPERPRYRTVLRVAVAAVFTQRGAFQLRIGVAPDVAHVAEVQDGSLVLAGAFGYGGSKERGRKTMLRLSRLCGTDSFEYRLEREDGRFTVRVPLDELHAAAEVFAGKVGARSAAEVGAEGVVDPDVVRWDVVTTGRGIADQPVAVGGGLKLPMRLDERVTLIATPGGELQVQVRR
jgi:CDP-glycerol glycerophosphotransferase